MSRSYKKVLFSIGIFILFLWIINFAFANSKNYENYLLRLHVIPNSNSCEDQDLKLDVRDIVLDYMKENFYYISSKDEMMINIKDDLDNIKLIVQNFIQEREKEFKIDVQLVNMSFPNVNYGLYTVPSGSYDALRIIIGEGEGENWWCVLFPPLCISNSTNLSGNLDKDVQKLDVGYASLVSLGNNSIKAEKIGDKKSADGIRFKLKFWDFFK